MRVVQNEPHAGPDILGLAEVDGQSPGKDEVGANLESCHVSATVLLKP